MPQALMHPDASQAGTDPEDSPNAAAVRQALTASHQHCLSYLQRRLGSAEEAREVMQVLLLRAIDCAAPRCRQPRGRATRNVGRFCTGRNQCVAFETNQT